MPPEKAYVLGHPVAHSKSPAMHNAAYRALGLNWEYGFADREREADALVFLNVRGWRALNVTMPWKPLAYEVATDRSAAADLALGANVLVNWGGRVHADNTDGKGCVSYLQRRGAQFAGARVAVCGTGPTSLAIMHACAEAGAAHIALLGRDSAKAQQALEAYRARLLGTADKMREGGREGGAGTPAGVPAGVPATAPTGASANAAFTAGSYDKERETLAAASIIIDATPLGMAPGDPSPFDTELLSTGQTVFDVVYGHGETALLHAARATGCDACDGAGMLVAQAVETVKDIANITGAFAIPAHLDLFAIMAEAAGFDL